MDLRRLRLRVEMEHSDWIWWAEGRGGAAERDAVRGEEECSWACRAREEGWLYCVLGLLGPKHIGDTGHSKRVSYAQNTM